MRMTHKGPTKDRRDPSNALVKMVKTLPQIEVGRSRWTRQAAFFLLDREIAHFHSSRQVDVRLTRKRLKYYSEPIKFDRRISRRSHSSDWVMFSIASRQDIVSVFELIKIAREANLAELKGRIGSSHKRAADSTRKR